MDLRCCLDRNILYICIRFDWKLKQLRCAIQSEDEPYCYSPVFFSVHGSSRCSCYCKVLAKAKSRSALLRPTVFRPRPAMSITSSCLSPIKLHSSTTKMLQMQQLRRWTYPTGGKQRAMAETCRHLLGLLAWDLMGHASHLPVLKKAVLQLLSRMRTCCIIPSSSYGILILPDELHDATSPTRIWRRSLSCTLLGSRMWTEATFVPVWSETCAHPTMSMYLVVDKTTICVEVGPCL